MNPSLPERALPRSATDRPETQLLLDFAARWHRFGGGSAEDIFVTFGVDRATFGRRVLAVLDTTVVDPRLSEALRSTYGVGLGA
ncbi:hypothetical protein [Gordonia sp. i37]|uniref:hypothetical protein n=1 Tax=Gordonia sp. i37 TaxID=1961707 RepID=UPI00111A72AF|nr:hypothetical protein [Gordonia sp. i37]